ncbi:MAG: MurR/RpiR family transcriptional regulator [Clostridiales bacterium]|nr:MurR/RpiR family transcriptional regulator [Clostridiales bacterium]MDY2835636.1 MurR/RpiR family transcriptional regulator [Candidatus Aphodomonas sp.]
MQDMADLIHRLNQSGKRLSKGHRKIADYIVQHYDKAVFMTASTLGESVGVSESTVVRFAGALGYEGYPQLQRAMQELVRHRLTASQRFEMATELRQEEVLQTVLRTDMQNIRSTIEGMDEKVFESVVRRIVNAKSIYVVGVRSASMLANFLAYYLHFVFDDVHLPTDMSVDIFEQISRIGPGDVLVGISFPRYSRRTLEAMNFARSRGAQVIGISDGPMSPLVEASDECLIASTDMASFVDSLAAPLSLINALIVAIGLERKEELSDHFRQLEEIWQQNHIYLERDKT